MRVSTDQASLIETSATLEEFFHQRVDDGLERCGLDGPDETRWYLVQLLCTGATGRRLFEDSDVGSRPPPLADLHRRAVEAPTESARRAELKRLGDLAMLVCSLFSGSLRRKPIKVDYVIAMGGAAYGTLADAPSCRSALAEVFTDLADHFTDYAIALSCVGEADPSASSEALPPPSLSERLARWEDTRHPGLARELQAGGVFVNGSVARH